MSLFIRFLFWLFPSTRDEPYRLRMLDYTDDYTPAERLALDVQEAEQETERARIDKFWHEYN